MVDTIRPLGALVSGEDERLETPKQFATRRGLSLGQVRHLIHTRRLEYVMIGTRPLIPTGAWTRFLETSTVNPCPDATKDPVSVGSKSASASTSPGPSMAAAASARLARQTANKLKRPSLNGSSSNAADTAQVIHLKS